MFTFLKTFFKTLVAPMPVKKKEFAPAVGCASCGWEGTIEQSLQNNRENDSCPKCGSTVLIYFFK